MYPKLSSIEYRSNDIPIFFNILISVLSVKEKISSYKKPINITFKKWSKTNVSSIQKKLEIYSYIEPTP